MTKSIAFILGLACLLLACNSAEEKKDSSEQDNKAAIKLKVPAFDRDSAFNFIEQQLAFGPRRPNTEAHKQCKDWLVMKFEGYGMEVIVQDFTEEVYFGERMQGYNIIARYNPEEEKRVMLSAHWDTRFKAEEDPDPKMQEQAIPGADDGGSGVGVILEVARLLKNADIPIGVDFVLFDLEDQGKNGGSSEETWCLGSQYWTKNPHHRLYKFGVNLDMVGSKGAKFKKEGFSMKYASGITNKVWKWAQRLGYDNYFIDRRTGAVIDDHYFLNTSGILPVTNIIYTSDQRGSTFGPHWHTHGDDLSNIDRNTLKAVGQVVTNVVYKEAEGTF